MIKYVVCSLNEDETGTFKVLLTRKLSFQLSVLRLTRRFMMVVVGFSK